ncbi:MAG: DUF6308 family protein [Streptosporangiaceae bacterium]
MRLLPTDDAVRAAARRLLGDLTGPGLDRAVVLYFRDPAFAGMTFSDLGRNPPDEITADDLLAVTLLDITWRPQVVRTLLGSHGAELSRLLAALPADLDLWDAGDAVSADIDLLWDALTAIEGIGTASATKLLARKRPRLCPISDHVVIRAVAVPGRTWDVLRCLMQDPAARARVAALRPDAAAGATLLRILDVALWVSHSETAAAHGVRAQAGMTQPG